jgi:hypothetical protein
MRKASSKSKGTLKVVTPEDLLLEDSTTSLTNTSNSLYIFPIRFNSYVHLVAITPNGYIINFYSSLTQILTASEFKVFILQYITPSKAYSPIYVPRGNTYNPHMLINYAKSCNIAIIPEISPYYLGFKGLINLSSIDTPISNIIDQWNETHPKG